MLSYLLLYSAFLYKYGGLGVVYTGHATVFILNETGTTDFLFDNLFEVELCLVLYLIGIFFF